MREREIGGEDGERIIGNEKIQEKNSLSLSRRIETLNFSPF